MSAQTIPACTELVRTALVPALTPAHVTPATRGSTATQACPVRWPPPLPTLHRASATAPARSQATPVPSPVPPRTCLRRRPSSALLGSGHSLCRPAKVTDPSLPAWHQLTRSDMSECFQDADCWPREHTSASCSTNTCQYPCNAGYARCSAADEGCPIDIQSDHANCGGCGHICQASEQCLSGTCVGASAIIVQWRVTHAVFCACRHPRMQFQPVRSWSLPRGCSVLHVPMRARLHRHSL